MTQGPGRFITLEGGEGSGKTTQIRRLVAMLGAAGISVLTTREPGGSPAAEAVRAVLLSGAAAKLGPDAEALLFAAARLDHVRQTIAPALAEGRWVLCDRFTDSTRVYQGALGAVDMRLLRALEQVACGDVRPDLTVILDLPPEQGLARAAARGAGADRFEREGLSYHHGVRNAFLTLALAEPQRCRLVNALGDEEEVAARVSDVVQEHFSAHFTEEVAEQVTNPGAMA